jgi:hypothetical protein
VLGVPFNVRPRKSFHTEVPPPASLRSLPSCPLRTPPPRRRFPRFPSPTHPKATPPLPPPTPPPPPRLTWKSSDCASPTYASSSARREGGAN